MKSLPCFLGYGYFLEIGTFFLCFWHQHSGFTLRSYYVWRFPLSLQSHTAADMCCRPCVPLQILEILEKYAGWGSDTICSVQTACTTSKLLFKIPCSSAPNRHKFLVMGNLILKPAYCCCYCNCWSACCICCCICPVYPPYCGCCIIGCICTVGAIICC